MQKKQSRQAETRPQNSRKMRKCRTNGQGAAAFRHCIHQHTAISLLISGDDASGVGRPGPRRLARVAGSVGMRHFQEEGPPFCIILSHGM